MAIHRATVTLRLIYEFDTATPDDAGSQALAHSAMLPANTALKKREMLRCNTKAIPVPVVPKAAPAAPAKPNR